LDPGVAKTQTAVHYIRNLLRSPDRKDVGVLYCVSRLAEVETLIEELGLEHVGVFTSSKEHNDLATTKPDEARVLITTQQKVDAILSDKDSFLKLEEFHYQGKPRQVRIWDETMMAAEELTIDLNRLGALADVLRANGALSKRLREVLAEVELL
jgi:hypothetical protein